MPPRVTDKQISQALYDCGGLITYAAKQLGTCYQTVSRRINKSDRLKTTLVNAKENKLDLAEEKLFEKIDEGNTGAIFFFLKCQGKYRGYIERQQHEHTGKDGGPMEFSDTERATRLASLMSQVEQRNKDEE